jgi:DNA-binding transcriptional regulator Cro
MMKKAFAIKKMDGVKPLADLLRIRRQAVYQWGEDVPELQAYKLRDLRPDLFPPEPKPKPQSVPVSTA